jgi:hypothetical protein
MKLHPKSTKNNMHVGFSLRKEYDSHDSVPTLRQHCDWKDECDEIK